MLFPVEVNLIRSLRYSGRKEEIWTSLTSTTEKQHTARPIFFAIVESVILANGLSAPQHSTYFVILEDGRDLVGTPPGVAENKLINHKLKTKSKKKKSKTKTGWLKLTRPYYW